MTTGNTSREECLVIVLFYWFNCLLEILHTQYTYNMYIACWLNPNPSPSPYTHTHTHTHKNFTRIKLLKILKTINSLTNLNISWQRNLAQVFKFCIQFVESQLLFQAKLFLTRFGQLSCFALQLYKSANNKNNTKENKLRCFGLWLYLFMLFYIVFVWLYVLRNTSLTKRDSPLRPTNWNIATLLCQIYLSCQIYLCHLCQIYFWAKFI